jgi:hypothetical protein
VSALLLALAVAATQRPDWIDGMPGAFPRERWVTAVGVADQRDAAEARARAGVAAFFESRVAASTRAQETERRLAAAGAELRVATTAASHEVAAITAKLLEGVEVADVWTDPANGRTHALAVLERPRAVEVLRRRLAEVDAEVSAFGARAAAEKERIGRARLGYRTLAAAARRGPLVHDLRILDPGAEAPAPVDLPAVHAAAEGALAEIAVSIRAEGEGAGAVAAGAARAVVATGLRVVVPPAPRDLHAAITVEAAPPAVSGAWTTVRLTARVRVEREGQEAFAAFAESAKGTAGRAEEARRRAEVALSAAVEERLGGELRARLEGN